MILRTLYLWGGAVGEANGALLLSASTAHLLCLQFILLGSGTPRVTAEKVRPDILSALSGQLKCMYAHISLYLQVLKWQIAAVKGLSAGLYSLSLFGCNSVCAICKIK